MNVKPFCFSFSLIVFAICHAQSQNLVPNGSFEEYDDCPQTLDDMYLCHNWVSALNSCDYYHECGAEFLGIPSNFAGYHWAYDGQAYAGLIVYYKTIFNGREVLGIETTEPLLAGTPYYVSFRYVRGNGVPMKRASNNLGIKISSTIELTDEVIDNTATLKMDTLCLDTLNWNLFAGSFVPEIESNYLLIGNFFDDANTTTIGYDDSGFYDIEAYYLIDDVRLSTDSLFVYNGIPDISGQNIHPHVEFMWTGSEIVILNNGENASYFLNDLTGRKILNGEVQRGEKKIIPSNELPKGLYFMVFYNKIGDFESNRFIKN